MTKPDLMAILARYDELTSEMRSYISAQMQELEEMREKLRITTKAASLAAKRSGPRAAEDVCRSCLGGPGKAEREASGAGCTGVRTGESCCG